jgi:hypothetical protein
MADNIIFLLKNATVDGSGTPIPCDGSCKTLYLKGDFGGGTVTLEASNDVSDATSWAPLTYGGNVASFTTLAVRTINLLKAGLSIRATLAGATSPDVTVAIY